MAATIPSWIVGLRGQCVKQVAWEEQRDTLVFHCNRDRRFVPMDHRSGARGTARRWVQGFVHWYNHVHRHSGIRFVTPAQRHAGEESAILRQRHALYQTARWSGETRNWTPIPTVSLNPERESPITPDTSEKHAA